MQFQLEIAFFIYADFKILILFSHQSLLIRWIICIFVFLIMKYDTTILFPNVLRG